MSIWEEEQKVKYQVNEQGDGKNNRGIDQLNLNTGVRKDAVQIVDNRLAYGLNYL